MFINRCYDNSDMNQNMPVETNMMDNGMMNNNCMCQPIMECPQERVCHREICYNVPHIIPINTRIINHHVYRHTYQPCYTCTMEDEVCNVYDNKCGF